MHVVRVKCEASWENPPCVTLAELAEQDRNWIFDKTGSNITSFDIFTARNH